MKDFELLIRKLLRPIVKNENTRHRLEMFYKKFKRRIMIYEDKKKYADDKRKYCQLNTRKNFDYNQIYENPILSEYRGQAGYPGTYFWQDLWGGKQNFGKKTM